MNIYRFKVCYFDETDDCEKYEYGVVAACSSSEAITKVEEVYFDIILSCTIMYDEDNDGILTFHGDNVEKFWEGLVNY